MPLIFLENSWCCWECSSLEGTRYNLFKSYRYDKYSQPDNESFDEIHQLENLLNSCKRYTFHELGSQVKNSNEQLSIMFKNIDGVTQILICLVLNRVRPFFKVFGAQRCTCRAR